MAEDEQLLPGDIAWVDDVLTANPQVVRTVYRREGNERAQLPAAAQAVVQHGGRVERVSFVGVARVPTPAGVLGVTKSSQVQVWSSTRRPGACRRRKWDEDPRWGQCEWLQHGPASVSGRCSHVHGSDRPACRGACGRGAAAGVGPPEWRLPCVRSLAAHVPRPA